MNKMKSAIYARVSTGKQDESLEEQIRILENFAESKNYILYNTYAEITSGVRSDRDEFTRLMQDAKAKRFDIVIVLKLDRFSRSMTDLINNVEILKKHDIDFISIHDGIETTTPQGKLLFHMLGAIGEFERSLIYERTKVGIDRAKREGKICHRPKKIINMKKVIDRYKQGIPLIEIAAIEHVSYSTLRNRIREEKIDLDVIRKTWTEGA